MIFQIYILPNVQQKHVIWQDILNYISPNIGQTDKQRQDKEIIGLLSTGILPDMIGCAPAKVRQIL